MVIQSKDFETRENLDAYVVAEFGTDEKQNRTDGHTIEGTAESLKKLFLNDTSRIHGIKVIITDVVNKTKTKTKK